MPHPPSGGPIGTPFIELQSVDSTNNYARSMIKQGLARHGISIFSHEQTAGKGQRGKAWLTEKGSNIILSVLINPAFLQQNQQFQLSACIAGAMHQFFKKHSGEKIYIKWPNDLYWQDRKAGGVLIENIVSSRQSTINNPQPAAGSQQSADGNQQSGEWKWAIVGIGININQTSFPGELQNPVSLKQITGKDFNAMTLAKELCSNIDYHFKKLITEGFDTIYKQYLEHLYKKNEKVKLKKGNRVFEVTIKGVNQSGQLITQNAIEETFDFGEVEWVK